MNARNDIETVTRKARGSVVRFLVRHYRLPPEEAEAIYHDAVLKMLGKLQRGELTYPSQPLLLAIARGLAANRMRTANTRRRILSDHAHELTPLTPVSDETQVVTRRILARLGELDEELVGIFLLRTVLGHSAREVGRRYGLTPGSVDRRRDRVAALLAEAPRSKNRRSPLPLAALLGSLAAGATELASRFRWLLRGLLPVAGLAILTILATPISPEEIHPMPGPRHVPEPPHTATSEVAPSSQQPAPVVGPILGPEAPRRDATPRKTPPPRRTAPAAKVPRVVEDTPPPASTTTPASTPLDSAPADREPPLQSGPEPAGDCRLKSPEEQEDIEDLEIQMEVVKALERAARVEDWASVLRMSDIYMDRWTFGELEDRVRLRRAQALHELAMWDDLLTSLERMRTSPEFDNHVVELTTWSAEALAMTGRCDQAWLARSNGELMMTRRELRQLCPAR